jgi:glycosyltransferase involved in cell wall biosynthesis
MAGSAKDFSIRSIELNTTHGSRLKKVLIISYYFPPYASVSVVRVRKFCKYLPANGWSPTVLTIDSRYYGQKVAGGLEDIESISILPLPYQRIFSNSILLKIRFLMFCALHIFFNRSKYSVVYVTGPPFFPFLISAFCNSILRVPIVLDFRDSWSVNHGYDGKVATKWLEIVRERLFSWVEFRSIRNSYRTVFANRMLKDDYSRLYKTESNKYVAIDNGFDPEDFLSVKPRRIVGGKAVILTGKLMLYTPELLQCILSALAELKNLTFVYVGGESDEVHRVASGSNVADQVVAYPYTPYSEMLNLIAGADYALMSNGMTYGVGTKIFEYLALGKPTICFVPKGSQVIREFSDQSNVIVLEAPHTDTSVLEGLRRLMSLSETSDASAIERYSRKLATSKLAELFDLADK